MYWTSSAHFICFLHSFHLKTQRIAEMDSSKEQTTVKSCCVTGREHRLSPLHIVRELNRAT